MKILSIIVPVYNVEPYLERCIRSLEDQNIPKVNFEIICINDGSEDGSRDILLNLQMEYDNILLIDQLNQGVSSARNRGIEKASGEYLLFIDADDFVYANRFESVLRNIDEQKAEVSFLSCSILNEQGKIVKQITYPDIEVSQIFLGTDAYFIARGDGSTDPDRMTGVLFRKDFFDRHNFFYLPNIPYLEDGEFISRILCLAKRCIFDKELFLYGTTREDSASSSRNFYSPKAIEGFLLAAKNLKRFLQEEELSERQQLFIYQPVAKYVLLAVNSSDGIRSFRRLTLTVKSLRKSNLEKLDLEECKPDYKFLGRVYNVSPYLSAVMLIIYPRMKRLLKLFLRSD